MKKVLIVDDAKNIRILLATCLEAEGYEIVTADNGAQALHMLQQHLFDLVLLDIKLPEVSGTEVLRRIRGNGIYTPVIIMTAFATIKNAVECTKLGALTYLQKPFTVEKVRLVIREITESFENDSFKLEFLLESAGKMLELNKPAEALKQLKQALAINPNYGKTYVLLSKAYRAQGAIQEAERFKKIAEQFEKDLKGY